MYMYLALPQRCFKQLSVAELVYKEFPNYKNS